ncbi:hypothetical protein ACFLSQ_03080 [Bacteroidota bacterium]
MKKSIKYLIVLLLIFLFPGYISSQEPRAEIKFYFDTSGTANYLELDRRKVYDSPLPSSLKDDVILIDSLWQKAADTLEIRLNSIRISPPDVYRDVLLNQITAFTNSKEWDKFYKKYKASKTWEPLDYKLMHEIMYKKNVYSPIKPLLTKYGYKIVGIDTEKHGFLRKEDCEKHKIKWKKEYKKVPIPAIVYLKLGRNTK